MTKEEAIKILERKIECMEDGAIYCDFGIDKEVFRMAIEALKQETILDKIKAEIVELDNKLCQQSLLDNKFCPQVFLSEDVDRKVHRTYKECIEIIDKYKAESEE